MQLHLGQVAGQRRHGLGGLGGQALQALQVISGGDQALPGPGEGQRLLQALDLRGGGPGGALHLLDGLGELRGDGLPQAGHQGVQHPQHGRQPLDDALPHAGEHLAHGGGHGAQLVAVLGDQVDQVGQGPPHVPEEPGGGQLAQLLAEGLQGGEQALEGAPVGLDGAGVDAPEVQRPLDHLEVRHPLVAPALDQIERDLEALEQAGEAAPQGLLQGPHAPYDALRGVQYRQLLRHAHQPQQLLPGALGEGDEGPPGGDHLLVVEGRDGGLTPEVGDDGLRLLRRAGVALEGDGGPLQFGVAGEALADLVEQAPDDGAHGAGGALQDAQGIGHPADGDGRPRPDPAPDAADLLGEARDLGADLAQLR